ncbi:MAG: DUF4166 domain-containing protein [Chthoniobacteraceae bacterium]
MPGTKRGCFAITHGANPLARQLARWSRLPRPASDAATTLQIAETAGAQLWHRAFGEDSISTRQWRENGWLVEYFAGWQLCFALFAVKGGLRYEQRGARLCARGIRLPMPLPLSPRIQAREDAAGEGRVRVEVAVSLPVIGPLITYRGFLEVGPAPL